jgi:preprotein translocase subunit YajC
VSLLALGLILDAGSMFGSFGSLPLLLVMFVAMYFLLIAPNQKKQKTWAAMLAALKTGDKVTTNGGMRGVIVSVKDDVLVDDVLVIRTAPDNVKFEIVRSAIAAVTTDEVATKE